MTPSYELFQTLSNQLPDTRLTTDELRQMLDETPFDGYEFARHVLALVSDVIRERDDTPDIANTLNYHDLFHLAAAQIGSEPFRRLWSAQLKNIDNLKCGAWPSRILRVTKTQLGFTIEKLYLIDGHYVPRSTTDLAEQKELMLNATSTLSAAVRRAYLLDFEDKATVVKTIQTIWKEGPHPCQITHS